MSLDGKIATCERSFFPLGTAEDLKQMEVLRRRCDAIVMGASTMRVYQKPCVISGQTKQPINILISSRLAGLDPRWPFFKSSKIRRILFVTEGIEKSTLMRFSRSSEVVLLKKPGPKHPVARQILTHLKAQNLTRILVEGGGGVMWDFASQNLIDEYHVTLTPKIVGGATAPSLVDGQGFKPSEVLNLKLRQCTVLGDEIFLTYAKTKTSTRRKN